MAALSRFHQAQNMYLDNAISELRLGEKKSHWIWFVFPQLKGLGKSITSNYYGLNGMNETVEYYNDPKLRKSLHRCFRLVLRMKNLEDCFGSDTVKIHSSATVFYLATKKNIFKKVLNKFFGGLLDVRTVLLLK